MSKEGGSWKSWKERWFVLRDGTLKYYDPEDVRAAGSFCFSEAGLTIACSVILAAIWARLSSLA
jgi:hypothetical protein